MSPQLVAAVPFPALSRLRDRRVRRLAVRTRKDHEKPSQKSLRGWVLKSGVLEVPEPAAG